MFSGLLLHKQTKTSVCMLPSSLLFADSRKDANFSKQNKVLGWTIIDKDLALTIFSIVAMWSLVLHSP